MRPKIVTRMVVLTLATTLTLATGCYQHVQIDRDQLAEAQQLCGEQDARAGAVPLDRNTEVRIEDGWTTFCLRAGGAEELEDEIEGDFVRLRRRSDDRTSAAALVTVMVIAAVIAGIVVLVGFATNPISLR